MTKTQHPVPQMPQAGRSLTPWEQDFFRSRESFRMLNPLSACREDVEGCDVVSGQFLYADGFLTWPTEDLSLALLELVCSDAETVASVHAEYLQRKAQPSSPELSPGAAELDELDGGGVRGEPDAMLFATTSWQRIQRVYAVLRLELGATHLADSLPPASLEVLEPLTFAQLRKALPRAMTAAVLAGAWLVEPAHFKPQTHRAWLGQA